MWRLDTIVLDHDRPLFRLAGMENEARLRGVDVDWPDAQGLVRKLRDYPIAQPSSL
jgi:hypothetical protein